MHVPKYICVPIHVNIQTYRETGNLDANTSIGSMPLNMKIATQIKRKREWNSLVKHLPSVLKALASTPSRKGPKEKGENRRPETELGYQSSEQLTAKVQ